MPTQSAPWAAVRRLFEQALPLDAAGREGVLADAAMAPGLATEVRSLLAAADSSGGFGSAPLPAPAAAAALSGQRLGAWRLVSRLGVGGMGEVWRARRDDGAYEGDAAVKLLRGGHDSAALLARFAREQRSLARLNHPHIARLFDAGLAADGRPYFVMELVEGERLDRAARACTLDERLRLFLQLADAVSHAHGHRLVHRDLKPGNVMVDRRGQVKLLDFGIAKALDPLDARAGEQTVEGQRPFTPHHASPEQVRSEPVGVPTDVYALGALLYGLLTGVRPTGRHAETAAEAMRAVLEEVPLPPSRLPEAEAPELADAARRARLRGDLDAIVGRALEKLPARRYDSVDALAADVRAHLEGRPITARRPSPAYLLGKFLRRHRGAVAAALIGGAGLATGLAATLLQARLAAAAGVAGLAGGLTLALLQARRAEQARERAEGHVADLRRLVREVVVEYGDAITHVPGGHVRQITLLAEAAGYLQGLARSGRDEPALRAEIGALHARIARLRSVDEYNAQVDLEQAEHHARLAVDALASAARGGRLDAAQTAWWADAQSLLGEAEQILRANPGAALAHADHAAEICTRGLERFPDSAALVRAAAAAEVRRARALFGWNRIHLDRPDDARAASERAAALLEAGASGHDEAARLDLAEQGSCLGAVALIEARRERWAEALDFAHRAADARLRASRLAPHNQMLRGAAAAELNMVGGLHLNVGDAVGALAATEQAWRLGDELLAAEPAHTAWLSQRGYLGFNHGRALAGVGRPRDALAALQASIHFLTPAVHDGSANAWHRRRLALTQGAQAGICQALGDGREAVRLADAAQAALQTLLHADPDDRDTLLALGELSARRAAWPADADTQAGWRAAAAAHYARAAAQRPLTAVHAELAAACGAA